MMLSTVIDKIVVFRDRVEITFKISLNRFLVNEGSHSNNDALPTELMPQTVWIICPCSIIYSLSAVCNPFSSAAFNIDMDDGVDGANDVVKLGGRALLVNDGS